MKKNLVITLVLVPLIVSGCFFNWGEKQEVEQPLSYSVYRSGSFGGFNFAARYPGDWQMAEQASGLLEDFKDSVSFIGPAETIKVLTFYQKTVGEVLAEYQVESQSQTEVNAVLATSFAGTYQGQRMAGVLVENGDFIVLLATDNPGSEDFAKFLNDFTFVKSSGKEAENITVSLYFDDGSSAEYNCEAQSVKRVMIKRPSEDLGLIPEVMKLLIQLSVPEELESEGLLTAIPLNTRIRSFGYEDNRAIVNFNEDLNEGGGSCLMIMRRSQIEKTLKALNEVSDLEIKEVEIQVEGDSQSALQP